MISYDLGDYDHPFSEIPIYWTNQDFFLNSHIYTSFLWVFCFLFKPHLQRPPSLLHSLWSKGTKLEDSKCAVGSNVLLRHLLGWGVPPRCVCFFLRGWVRMVCFVVGVVLHVVVSGILMDTCTTNTTWIVKNPLSWPTVDGRNPKQPHGMYKTLQKRDKLPTSTGWPDFWTINRMVNSRRGLVKLLFFSFQDLPNLIQICEKIRWLGFVYLAYPRNLVNG